MQLHEPVLVTIEITPDDWRALRADAPLYAKLRAAIVAAQRARLVLRRGRPLPTVERPIPDTKICRKCGASKPISDFYARSGRGANYGDGHIAYCKPCFNRYRVERDRAVLADPERGPRRREVIRAAQRAYVERKRIRG